MNIFIGLWIFGSKRKHLLAMLLRLEMMVLGLFMYFFMCLDYRSMFFSLIYLIYTACEGALGLIILVRMSRRYGGDYFRSFQLNY